MNFSNVSFEYAFGTAEQMPESTMGEVCFSGRSNVGKSSLINRVLGRKNLARVSERPGKTVTINFYRLEKMRLVDLPGYGYAKVADIERLRWADLMETYFGSGRDIRMVFQLIDMRHEPSQYDLDMIDFLRLDITIVLPTVLAMFIYMGKSIKRSLTLSVKPTGTVLLMIITASGLTAMTCWMTDSTLEVSK